MLAQIQARYSYIHLTHLFQHPSQLYIVIFFLCRKLFIETHQDVSILFADVVNYTFLTTKLDIKDLVETLHELFQRIDSACIVCSLSYFHIPKT